MLTDLHNEYWELFTLAQQRLGSGFDENLLERILKAELEEIERVAGPDGAIVEVFTNTTWVARTIIHVVRPITVPSGSPVENPIAVSEARVLGEAPVALGADDWLLVDKYRLLRLGSGGNPATHWGQYVSVGYTPVVDRQLRNRVLLDLVQLQADFRTTASEHLGDFDITDGNYEGKRREVLSQLAEDRAFITG
jgi:hypothetical protein